MPSSILPPELLHSIFTYAKKSDSYSSADTETLFRLAWTSTGMRAIALPILLQYFRCLEILYPADQHNMSYNEYPESLLILFRVVWPSYRHIVKSIAIEICRSNNNTAINDLLVVLPGLQSLELTYDGNSWVELMGSLTDEVRTEVFPRLRSLSLKYIRRIPFSTLLSTFYNLEALILRGCSPDDARDGQFDSEDESSLLLMRGCCHICGEQLCTCSVPLTLPVVVKPLKSLTIRDVKFRSNWSDAVRSFEQFQGLCHIQSFTMQDRDSELTYPHGFNPPLATFPKMIPMFVRMKETLQLLDVSSFLFLHSLSHLAVTNPSSFLTTFSLETFHHLEKFQATVLIKPETARLELASLFFTWLARQLQNQSTTSALKHILVHIRPRHIRQWAPPQWDWDGMEGELVLDDAWPDLCNALILCEENALMPKVEWRVHEYSAYNATKHSKEIWKERVVGGLKRGLYVKGDLDLKFV
ncbi:hypothetical protein DL96DRAFT_1703552 [Flagelloscypha sp. PMI_526]|nr:hypothetical protein DL96DRAFT_1703552 [Flagelloscypha sp. PMI_526]